MDGRSIARARRALLPALVGAAVAVLAPATAGGQGSTVVWQARRPTVDCLRGRCRTRVPPSASKRRACSGTTIRIRVNQLPAGARLVRLGQAPARVAFRWRPKAAPARRVALRLHRCGTAPRRRRITVRGPRRQDRVAPRFASRAGRSGEAQNAVLRYAVAARSAPNESSRVLARLKSLTPEHAPHVLLLSSGKSTRRAATGCACLCPSCRTAGWGGSRVRPWASPSSSTRTS
jgi:hypothetical protein